MQTSAKAVSGLDATDELELNVEVVDNAQIDEIIIGGDSRPALGLVPDDVDVPDDDDEEHAAANSRITTSAAV